MPAPTLTIGAITIIPLSDGGIEVGAADVLPSVTAEQWKPFREYLSASNLLSFNLGSFLIHERDQWTLVDTGIGNRPGSPGGALLGELEWAGLRPEQISRVIITHLHHDHIGWNTVDREGRTVVLFDQARHILQRRDWDYFTQPEIRDDTPVIGLCVEPVQEAGLLDLIDGDRALSAGISTLFTPGHTPGHQSVLVSSGGEKAIIAGDVTHTPAQVTHPEWSPSFDVDQELSIRTRGALWDRIEQEGMRVCAGHYPHPGVGGIVRVEGKRRWQPL